MAIIKNAKNINIVVKDVYTSISKVSYEESEEVLIKATKDDLSISSQKRAVLQGSGKDSKKNDELSLRVLKVEGPFDEKGKKVVIMEKDKWYSFKATQFNRKPKDKELKMLKWARQYDDGKLVEYAEDKETDKLDFLVKSSNESSKVRIYAYFKEANKNVSTEAEIELQEVILIVGTEQHSDNPYGNKMFFPAQAVREIKQNYIHNKYITVLMFTDGYNAAEITYPENSAKAFNSNTNFKKINSVSELIQYLNNGDSKVKRSKVKISVIKIFSHGLPSILDFGLDGKNELSQRFKIENIYQIKKESFISKPIMYSYACRTGNADPNWKTNSYGKDWADIVKPQESLAQKLADNFNATVYAYIRRSEYVSTWNDKGDKSFQKQYIEIEDENVDGSILKPVDWDEVLWNPNGAYALPTVGTTPKGLPSQMYKFEKGKNPAPNK